MTPIPASRFFARLHAGPPPRAFSPPTPHRVVTDEGTGYVEMLEATKAHGAVTFQFITDEDGACPQITTIVWPAEKHAEVMAMLGRLA